MDHLALLLSVLIVPLLAVAAQAQPIYDIDGHELTSDGWYQVAPAAARDPRTYRGGLIYHSITGPCRPIVQLWAAIPAGLLGFPVNIKPRRNATGGPPSLSSDVEIFFEDIPGGSCSETKSSQWYAADHNITKRTHVLVGDVPTGKPAVEVFRVERRQAAAGAKEGYKLTSCDGSRQCRDIGLYEFEESDFLTMDQEPLVVVFRKCNPQICASIPEVRL